MHNNLINIYKTNNYSNNMIINNKYKKAHGILGSIPE